eukprot:gb/GEZN01004723.1/.p1 GENE.gb/GEZN01004723.1/~~gb/GEZN01004723.1/.p1  ORF type:complete len:496 (-),score=30.64 gb/GEZN01004723.1/:405-1892(-)
MLYAPFVSLLALFVNTAVCQTCPSCQPGFKTCVTSGYCDTDNALLFKSDGTNIPCGNRNSIVDRSSCFICNNGDLGGSEKVRSCIWNQCVELTQDEGRPCCTDYGNNDDGDVFPDYEVSPVKSSSDCDESVKGLYCKPPYVCKFHNNTDTTGVCKSIKGSRRYSGLNGPCTLIDATLTKYSPMNFTLCDNAPSKGKLQLECDLGQDLAAIKNGSVLISTYDKGDNAGTCRAINKNKDGWLASEKCFGPLQCPWGKTCNIDKEMCVDAAYANTSSVKPCFNTQDCGWTQLCKWKNANAPDLGGICADPFTQQAGDQCNDNLLCGSGLYCNGDFCETPLVICACAHTGTSCGRGSTCNCPDPTFLTSAGEPKCRDDDPKINEDKYRYMWFSGGNSSLKSLAQCLQANKIQGDGNLVSLFDSESGIYKYKLTNELCKFSWKNDVLMWPHVRGDALTPPPTCAAAPVYGASYAVNSAAHAVPMMLTLVPAIAVLINLVF